MDNNTWKTSVYAMLNNNLLRHFIIESANSRGKQLRWWPESLVLPATATHVIQ